MGDDVAITGHDLLQQPGKMGFRLVAPMFSCRSLHVRTSLWNWSACRNRGHGIRQAQKCGSGNEGGQTGLGSAHRDDDLFYAAGAVAGTEHTRDVGLSAGIDDDLATARQLDDPVGVGQQADLHKHPSSAICRS